MRVAPVGLNFASIWREANCTRNSAVFNHGADIAHLTHGHLTHGHPTGYLPAGFFALLIYLLALEVELKEAIAICTTELIKHPHHEETLDAIEGALKLVEDCSSPRDVVTSGMLGEGWIAEESLAIALYCLLTATDFESGVISAVNHDGDSDSTGAIAGNILGVINGETSVPERWLVNLELEETIIDMAVLMADSRV